MEIVNRYKNASVFDDDDLSFASNSCPLPQSGSWMLNIQGATKPAHTQKPFIVGVTGGTASGTDSTRIHLSTPKRFLGTLFKLPTVVVILAYFRLG